MLLSLPLSLFRLFVLSVVLIVSQSFAQDVATEPPASLHPNSRWIAASWDDLAGAFEDDPREAVAAWLASCARPQASWRKACAELSALKNADSEVIRIWMVGRLQPYRIESLVASSAASTTSLLTGYYEPVLPARREADDVFRYPLYRLPADLERGSASRVWYTRQDIDTAGSQAQQALQGRAIAYLQSPLDVLALQIQGSGQLDLVQADGTHQRIRLAFAGSNNQPYKSVGAWLRDTHGVRELSWPAIKAWALAHPLQMNALVWSNPRVVFFKESAVNKGEESVGPKGAQGLPLTAGRSIAVDPKSIPYGTPVWLVSSGASVNLKRLVMAQDTGAAITGAVRADYYVGSGDEAGEIAGRLKQNLQMWVLWPK